MSGSDSASSCTYIFSAPPKPGVNVLTFPISVNPSYLQQICNELATQCGLATSAPNVIPVSFKISISAELSVSAPPSDTEEGQEESDAPDEHPLSV